ncbi:MAG: hypothetical protein QOH95_2072, partial [Gaiellaceae bacterium]|nr:hypothetical protein [Gaiellaceae bacterium]
MRLVTRAVLESAGYAVLEASHGDAALARTKASQPDIVITNLMMPVMSGGELIEHLRADPETATIPIVVVSGTAGSLETPADFVLGKPFKPEILLDAVRTLARGEGH